MKEIDWENVKRILVIRLRSIGDTVLCTPSLIALRRFLPEARIDVLLEGWVAPLLDEFKGLNNVLIAGRDFTERLQTAREIRAHRYDVVFNLHGGTTSTFFARASGAPHMVGFANYQYSFLYNHRMPPAAEFWGRKDLHSAEQQLALLGSVGVPVQDKPASSLRVTEKAAASLAAKLEAKAQTAGLSLGRTALVHPVAAFDTKQWATENFARIAEFLSEKGFFSVAVSTPAEAGVLNKLVRDSKAPIIAFDDLSLPEITALAARSRLFVGNDSGIAHMAAAVGTPSVVIFGSSNRVHWRPWTSTPNEIIYNEFPCQPCAGYTCEEFGEPKCILSVGVDPVKEAIERLITIVP